MANKILKGRMVNKHDSEANWLKATNFKPMAGEIIVYDIDNTHDYERIKIGDGSTLVSDLPFINENELALKVDKVNGKGLSTNDYTTTEKNKLSGIESGANKTVTDNALNTTSENPVQNKVVTSKLNEISNLVGDTKVSTQISNAIANKVDKVSGKGLSTNDYTTTEKNKLAGIATGAEVNQNAFANIKVGSTTVVADAKSDTLELVGSNITITPDATNDKVTIGITKENVTNALGYTPPTTNTTYSGAGSSLGLVKTGGDVTISGGVITVNDDSHAHTIANVDGLQTALDGKANSSHGTHVSYSTTAPVMDGTASVGSASTVARSDHKHPTDTSRAAKSDLDSLKTLVGDTTVSSQISTAIANKADTSSLTSHTGNTSNPHSVTKSQVGLGNVENKSSATIRGELTKANVTTALGYTPPTTDTTYSVATNTANGLMSTHDRKGVTTAGTGSAYTATVDGITALTAGVSFVMIPHTASASTTPTLNVNSLGAKTIKRRLSSLGTSTQSGYTETWLAVGKPYRVVYDGTYWIVEGLTKPAAADLYGTLAVNKGGTGATDAATARTNLGIPTITYGTADPSGGSNGDIYIKY